MKNTKKKPKLATKKLADANIVDLPGLKGHLVFWKMDTSIEVPREDVVKSLEKFGALPRVMGKNANASKSYADLLPKSDYVGAMGRALRKVCKVQNDEDLSRFAKALPHAGEERASWVIAVTKLLEATPDAPVDINLHKEVTVSVHKVTGKVGLSHEFPQKRELLQSYRDAQGSADYGQLTAVAMKIIKNQCFGIPLRQYGGFYFVNDSNLETLQTLREFFLCFPQDMMRLLEIPIRHDDLTNSAIEDALVESLDKEIKDFVKTVKEKVAFGKVTSRFALGKKEAAEQIMEKVDAHRRDLRTQSKMLTKKLDTLNKVLTDAEDDYRDAQLRHDTAAKKKTDYTLEEALSAF